MVIISPLTNYWKKSGWSGVSAFLEKEFDCDDEMLSYLKGTYDGMTEIIPVETGFVVVIDKHIDFYREKYIVVNGMNESREIFGIESVRWNEWLGMKVYNKPGLSVDGVVASCLYEMTLLGLEGNRTHYSLLK